MSDLMGHESIDDRARRASTQLRRTASTRSVAELPLRTRRHWLAPIVAVATIGVVVVGLIAIGTNRNDPSTGNNESRFHWLVTDLPAGWKVQQVLDPFSPSDRRPPESLDSIYATSSAPAGPVVAVAGSEIVPGEGTMDETNYREFSIDGRRAAFADNRQGQRILYIESDRHWMRLTSRDIDDATLTRFARSAVRSSDGTATIPPANLSDGLELVAPPRTPQLPILSARLDGGVSAYGVAADGTRTLDLSVGRPSPSVRGGVALQSAMVPTTIGTTAGYSGSFQVGPPPIVTARTLYWEHDGLAFYMMSYSLNETQMLAAANSIRPVSDKEWTRLVDAPSTNQATVATSPLATTPAETTPVIHDVPIDVSVAVHSPTSQTWSGTLPTGEAWTLDMSRVFDTISFLGEVDGQSAGISGTAIDVKAGATRIQGFDGGFVVTANKQGSAMRIIRSNGDRYTIPLHDLPGTNGLRVAALALPGTSAERRIELVDAEGTVIQSYVDGVNYDAAGNAITQTG